MMTHRTYIRLSGLTWLLIGFWLLYKGLKYTAFGSYDPNSFSMLFGKPSQGAAILIAAGLIVGYAKGRFVLQKSAHRVAGRILAQPLPIPLKRLYAPSYLVLIASMMALGMAIKFLPIPIDLRGFIDIAIGSALINGSMFYFKYPAPADLVR